MLRVEVNGGYFDRGTNPQEDVLGEQVQLIGASVQVALQQGIPVGSSIDYRLYRNAPESTFRLFQPEEYSGGFAWMVAVEATVLNQTLKDPEVTGGTTNQRGMAADLNFRGKYNHTRFRIDLQMRDLAYILHSAPSLSPYSDFADVYDVTSNFFGVVGVDQHFPELGLTTGIVLGLELPATITSPKPIAEIEQEGTRGDGEAVYVVRGQGDYTILPFGEDVVVQFAAKLTSRLDFADNNFASILDIYYSRDPNRTRGRQSGPDEQFEYKFDDFDQLGFNLTLQAKF
jgi:hypothetical protein